MNSLPLYPIADALQMTLEDLGDTLRGALNVQVRDCPSLRFTLTVIGSVQTPQFTGVMLSVKGNLFLYIRNTGLSLRLFLLDATKLPYKPAKERPLIAGHTDLVVLEKILRPAVVAELVKPLPADGSNWTQII